MLVGTARTWRGSRRGVNDLAGAGRGGGSARTGGGIGEAAGSWASYSKLGP